MNCHDLLHRVDSLLVGRAGVSNDLIGPRTRKAGMGKDSVLTSVESREVLHDVLVSPFCPPPAF